MVDSKENYKFDLRVKGLNGMLIPCMLSSLTNGIKWNLNLTFFLINSLTFQQNLIRSNQFVCMARMEFNYFNTWSWVIAVFSPKRQIPKRMRLTTLHKFTNSKNLRKKIPFRILLTSWGSERWGTKKSSNTNLASQTILKTVGRTKTQDCYQ